MSEKPQFAICVKNDNYPASLELWKVYRVLPDEKEGETATFLSTSFVKFKACVGGFAPHYL